MTRPLRSQLEEIRDLLFPRTDNALGCGKKKRYVTEELAVRALHGRQKFVPETLFHYHCPECGGWHLTKMAQDGVEEKNQNDGCAPA